jgi:NhaA family Na+:H+ antiporter
MPIFALANAGVTVPDLSYMNIFQYSPEIGSVSMGVFLGLLLGKPIGITLASFLAIKFKFGEMPDKATWKMLFAVACLGGIGFTMSIFVDNLAFDKATHQTFIDMGKIAILMASTVAAIVGAVLISLESKREHRV